MLHDMHILNLFFFNILFSRYVNFFDLLFCVILIFLIYYFHVVLIFFDLLFLHHITIIFSQISLLQFFDYVQFFSFQFWFIFVLIINTLITNAYPDVSFSTAVCLIIDPDLVLYVLLMFHLDLEVPFQYWFHQQDHIQF